jgi:hypothetical protein
MMPTTLALLSLLKSHTLKLLKLQWITRITHLKLDIIEYTYIFL